MHKIAGWIKNKVTEAGANGCVFGLSGGIDSAVVGALCKQAFPQAVLGLTLPCHSLSVDIQLALDFAKKFDIPVRNLDLSPTFENLFQALEAGKAYNGEKDLAVVNLKPRLRMISLYYYAAKMNYLVVGTGNKSELEMGYFTKYGDGGVDLLPLGNLLKSGVRKLAVELKIPQAIIDKPPSAGLWEGQTDEGEMGITYAELDNILTGRLDGIAKDKIALVKKRQAASQHKRALPEIY
ncbi:MAG: NAD(+) synthase [Candidatus Margulisiibacteriota bacterium]